MTDSSARPRRFTNYDDRASLGSRLRARRLGPLLQLVDTVFQAQGRVRIVDLGGEPNYWNILPPGLLAQRRIHITLVNLPGAPIDTRLPAEAAAHFGFESGDACHLPHWPDASFDIVHSNSVIEHVGGWSRRQAFAREALRLAPHCFIQTPNFWFPVEPHYMAPLFHWLPQPLQVAWLMRMHLGHMHRARTVSEAMLTIESVQLLNRRMMEELFPGTRILTERVLGLPKSFVACR